MHDTLSSRLRESFDRHAERPAVFVGNEMATYAELGARARGVAAALSAHGIGRGHRVGLWMEKSVDGLAALLGTLLSGAAYIPIDVRAPSTRSLAIAADADISALVVDAPRGPLVRELRAALPRLNFVLETERIAALRADVVPGGDPPGAEDTAYILFTSGSTGKPKGVVLSHRAALGFADWCLRTLGPRPADRMVSHAPWHFDLSTFDLFVTLLAGASVRLLTSTEAMLPAWIARNLADWGTTVWYSVPSTLIGMVEQTRLGELWPQARLVLFAGEPFPTPKLRRLHRSLPQARLFNLFGPTETNVCTYYEVQPIDEDETRPIPIGRVCENLEGLILDEELREVAPGVEGDLWIAGANLLTGYWGDPELTARRLRRDPRPGHVGFIYNTGDRVRRREDGNLIFHGRRDHMVKVRGYRVEIGEVESALQAVAGLAEAAVVAVREGDSARLVGFLCWSEQDGRSEAEVAAQLRERLPLYMIPQQWVALEQLPRTSNGKVDRKRLEEVAARQPGSVV